MRPLHGFSDCIAIAVISHENGFILIVVFRVVADAARATMHMNWMVALELEQVVGAKKGTSDSDGAP